MKGAAEAPRERYLLVRLRSLGDTVLMTPLLGVLRRGAACRIGVVVEEPFAELLRDAPGVDHLFVIGRGPRWWARLAAARHLRAFRPTTAIDLHGGPTSAILTRLSGARRRVGYASSAAAFLYNIRVPDSRHVWQRETVHTVEHQLSVLKHLGLEVDPIPPLQVPVCPAEVKALEAVLQSLPHPRVLIHPAAALETKQWQAQKFSRLADILSEEGLGVVLTAGPGEEGLLERVRRACRRSPTVIPPSGIRRFAALVSLCPLYVGNDTGPTHIAAALGRKIVVIWGSSDYRVWFPWRTPHRLVRSDLPCIPCPGYTCWRYQEPRCIRSIEVERVVEAVRSLR